jgi:hypothetical protein
MEAFLEKYSQIVPSLYLDTKAAYGIYFYASPEL